MGIISGLVAVALATAVVALPLVALRAKVGLARLVEVSCWVAVAVAVVVLGVTLSQSLVTNQTTVTVPLAVHSPGVTLPGLELVRPEAVIVSGGADRATLVISGLSWATRLWLAVEVLVQCGVAVVLALVVRKLAANTRVSRPFSGLARPLLTSAYVLFGGSLLWSVAGSVGSYLAGREALQLVGWSGPDPTTGVTVDSLEAMTYYGWPEVGDWSVTFSFLPMAFALVLALLGLVFRAGERMQADTEGLV